MPGRAAHPARALPVKPLLAGDGVLYCALISAGQRREPGLGEGTDVHHADGCHRRLGGPIDRHRLGEDPVQPEIIEPVPDQLVHALAGQTLAPAAAQQSVAELGMAIWWTLVGTGWRRELPQADELPCHYADPVAEAGNQIRCREPSQMPVRYLRASPRAAVAEVAHYLRVAI